RRQRGVAACSILRRLRGSGTHLRRPHRHLRHGHGALQASVQHSSEGQLRPPGRRVPDHRNPGGPVMSTISPQPVTTSTLDQEGRVIVLPEKLVVRPLYLGCWSQASYLVGDRSTGRAIAVDPRRDIDEILTAASEDGLTIEWVI